MNEESKINRKDEMLADYLYKVSLAIIVGVILTAINEVYRHVDDISVTVQYASFALVTVGLITSVYLAYTAYTITNKNK